MASQYRDAADPRPANSRINARGAAVDKLTLGIDETIVNEVSWTNGEPQWMRDFRIASYTQFAKQPMPNWGSDLSEVVLDDRFYDISRTEKQVDRGDSLPEAEQKVSAGLTAQFESESVAYRHREDLERLGVIFCDMATALWKYPEIVAAYFGRIVPPGDNKFSALNSAVWSSGSFIYVPPDVKVPMPLQAYGRSNAVNMGQFERVLIIADQGSEVHYIEGCSAPVYTTDSLHCAVVEIVVKASARVSYTTVQNWSNNVCNLVTKRARVETEGHMQWIDGNIGSRLTVAYPAVVLVGPKACGEASLVAYAGRGQHQDVGAKMTHAAPETTSRIVAKSISKDGGRTSFLGLVRVDANASGCRSHVWDDALMLDDESTSERYPCMEVDSKDADIDQEATVSRITDGQLFYLMSRGLSRHQAAGMIVNGFIEPVTRTLPMEYAVEWSRLIELQMEGSVG